MKRKIPHLKSWTCLDCIMTALSNAWMFMSTVLSWAKLKNGEARHSGKLLNQSTIDDWAPKDGQRVVCVCAVCVCLNVYVCRVLWCNYMLYDWISVCVYKYMYIYICTILVSRRACVCVWVDMHPFKLYLHNVRPGGKVQKLAGWDKHVDVQMLKVWNDASDHIILEQCAYSCAANI